jgi:hypothetical protein
VSGNEATQKEGKQMTAQPFKTHIGGRGIYRTHRVGGVYNYVIRQKGKTYLIGVGAGTDDDVFFYTEKGFLYALVLNTRMGYCGLTQYALADKMPDADDLEGVDIDELLENQILVKDQILYKADPCFDIFLQNEDDIQNVLGKKQLKLQPVSIAKRLHLTGVFG